MVNYCRVIGCHNRSDKETRVQYYRLPKVIRNQGEDTEKLSNERRRLWLASLRQNFLGKNLENIRVCSAHFVTGKKAALYHRESADWVPSINMTASKYKDVHEKGQALSEVVGFEHHQQKIENKKDFAAAESLLMLQENSDTKVEQGICTETQTDLTAQLISSMISELQYLRTENLELRAKMEDASHRYDRKAFEGQDEKVLYYTGLSTFTILWTLYGYLEPVLINKKSLSKFEMLILTLMRLRMNVSGSFLSGEFRVSLSTVYRVFIEVIDVMYVRMKPLVVWPSREALCETMPMHFQKHFGTKCVAIIDCFEVLVDQPTNLKVRTETWSSYKHRNTVKFLLGITPQGTVSYMSKAWGGSVNDKYITENGGFLNNILPGDLVLADQGVNLQTGVQSMMAEDKIQVFLKVESQLSPVDFERIGDITHVRIHVQRVIGTVRKKYSILNGSLPVEFLICKESDDEQLTTVDKIGLVCCACVNLCNSGVDLD